MLNNRRSLLTRRPPVEALRLLFVTALLITALGTATARPGWTAPAGAVSPEGLLNPDGTLDLSGGFQGTLDLSGWEVTLDGERGPVLEPASRSAAAPVTGWNAMPNAGLNGTVYALAVVGSDLYVGGAFIQTGDGTVTNLGNIARYDTTAGTWHALSNQGLDDSVLALAVDGGDLYVGGAFTQTGDGMVTNLGYIARYNTTADTWHALPHQGLNYWVRALAMVGGDLYAGGLFTQTGDGTLNNLGRIARYDTTAKTWNALSKQGLNSTVQALAVVGRNLYVGGQFTQTGDGTLTNLGYIARYSTRFDSWDALPNQGLSNTVGALAVVGSDLYVGGSFTQTGDGTLTNLGRIARYDTTAGAWYALSQQGLNADVRALAVVGGDLYVGGQFTQTGIGSLANLGFIARYDTTASTWNALSQQGLNADVRALAVVGSDLYVGGSFSQIGDGTLTNLNRIARYDTTALPWHALNNWGLENGSTVYALAVVGGNLYVGGDFTQTGDGTLTNLGYIVRYDTTTSTWHALDRWGLNGTVLALAVMGSDLYVGGDFTQTGDMLKNHGCIARYDTAGDTWHALPNQGLNAYVHALAVVGSDLYVGGLFTQTGDGTLTNLGYIARYNIAGDTWHALPNQGLSSVVGALAMVGSDLYVGGGFTQTGDTSKDLGYIARYDTAGDTWHPLPNQGLNNWVGALAMVGSDLYVGGWFTQTGDTSKNLGYIARYDTTAGIWHGLDKQGLNHWVQALAVVGSDLYAGGSFTQTGDGTLTDLGGIARYDTAASTWHALPNQGLNGWGWALAVLGNDLYVGGGFTQTGDGAVTYLGNIARYTLFSHDLFLPLVIRQ